MTLREIEQIDVPEALAQHDVFWFRLGFTLGAEVLASARPGSIIATPVTGLDRIDLAACERLGLRVVSLRGETDFLEDVRATAELTVGLLLTLIRKIPPARADVLAGRWDRDAFQGTELFQKTAGIVGLGRLGRIVARYLAAMGMEVSGYDPHKPMPDGVDAVPDLPSLFSGSDVVTLHPSYGTETHHLVDEDVLRQGRPGLVLVNTSRGGILPSHALLTALQEGWVRAAAIDVIEEEPRVGRDHPLVAYAREHDNLLIVPHIGGNTAESLDKAETFLAGRVASALRERAASA